MKYSNGVIYIYLFIYLFNDLFQGSSETGT